MQRGSEQQWFQPLALNSSVLGSSFSICPELSGGVNGLNQDGAEETWPSLSLWKEPEVLMLNWLVVRNALGHLVLNLLFPFTSILDKIFLNGLILPI